MKIAVRYFALLAEQAGVCSEQVEHEGSLASLYTHCAERHSFTLTAASVRPALNEEFVDWTQPLVAGDTVAFIPPVSGG